MRIRVGYDDEAILEKLSDGMALTDITTTPQGVIYSFAEQHPHELIVELQERSIDFDIL